MQHNNKGLREIFGQKVTWKATAKISSSVAAEQLSPVFLDLMEGEKNTQRHLNLYCWITVSVFNNTSHVWLILCSLNQTSNTNHSNTAQTGQNGDRGPPTGDLQVKPLLYPFMSHAINSELDMDLWSPSPNRSWFSCCLTPSWTASVVYVAHYGAEKVLPQSLVCAWQALQAEYCRFLNLLIKPARK